MTDTNNSPDGGTGDDVSVADITDALADVFVDPTQDNDEDRKAKTADEPDDSETDEPDNSGEDDADEEDGESEDPAGEEADEDDDKPGDYDGGRFAAYNAKVKLEDGTTVSVKNLVDGSLRQGDYTRKTQELSDSRKAFEHDQMRNSQLTQQLDEQLQLATQWLEATRPQRPNVAYSEDPMVHGEYNDAQQRWNEAAGYIGQQVQRAQETYQTQQKDAREKYEKAEDDALRSAIPALRDPAKFTAFVSEAKEIAPDYGISADELEGVKDHRQWLVLRDAMAYRRLQSRTSKVKETIESKPRMVKGGKRSNPKKSQDRARQARTERLRDEGSVESARASLMDMDL